MKHNLTIPLLNFNGSVFVAPGPADKDGKPTTMPMSLKSVLENACVNANPHEFSTGDQKMQIFQLLLKVHAAAPYAELSAEDVTLLKRLVGSQATVTAVGAVFTALENPAQEPTKTRVEAPPEAETPQ